MLSKVWKLSVCVIFFFFYRLGFWIDLEFFECMDNEFFFLMVCNCKKICGIVFYYFFYWYVLGNKYEYGVLIFLG